MTLILAFLVAIIAVALWWLVGQGITSKPWLETGVTTSAGAAPDWPAEWIGLGVFLTVASALFVLFGSAFVMRMDEEAWWSLSLPPIVWANTLQLILASIFLHLATEAARRGDYRGTRRDIAVAGIATAGFLVGQLIAWRELTASGGGLATTPAASFFYLLSGLHGLHILGGMAALGLVGSRRADALPRLRLSTGLCATYWHFLLLVWLGLLALFLGWANRFVDICRSVLT